jgi:ParB family chromosome partitioning protein
MHTNESRLPQTTKAATPPCEGDFLWVDLDLLDDNPFQPRTEMDPAMLEELVAGIVQSGLLQPIAVRPQASGRYFIVAGHRRAAAFRLLRDRAKTEPDRRKYRLIRATIARATSDAEMATAAYVENAAREQLTPLEEGRALARIKQLGNHPNASAVAAATGQPERRVRRLLKLAPRRPWSPTPFPRAS